MRKSSSLVALASVKNSPQIAVFDAGSKEARIGLGIRLGPFGARWSCEGSAPKEIGKRRDYDLDEKVTGVIGLYDRNNMEHMSKILADSEYAGITRYEQDQHRG